MPLTHLLSQNNSVIAPDSNFNLLKAPTHFQMSLFESRKYHQARIRFVTPGRVIPHTEGSAINIK